AAVALARWHPPCKGAATPAASVAAPAGGRAGRGRQPLRASHCKQLCLWVAAAPASGCLRVAVSTGGGLRASSRTLVGSLGRSRLPLQSA
ncbi:hypothetical protein BHM03_00028458, partial [Ensete ventricosum]